MAFGLQSVAFYTLTLTLCCCTTVRGQVSNTGAYHSVCSPDTASQQCGIGMICVQNQCICDTEHIYDNVRNICKKLCRGTKEGLVKHGDINHQYDLLKRRYTNCVYVDGNLEITSLEHNYDLSFLKDIEEVTGYVLIVNIFSNYLNLTNLQLIRGKQLFEHQGRFHSLYVALNSNPRDERQGLMEMQFVNLREIMRGEVYFYNNNLLCFIDTIRWDDINPNSSPHWRFQYDSVGYQRECGKCHSSCYNPQTKDYHCWGEGPNMCQKLNHIKAVCSETCDGRCFGRDQNQCCYPECAAGCSGPRKTDCFACKNFYNEGQCVPHCPPMMLYDTNLFKHVPNPDGKYTFGSLCVNECPGYMLRNGGSCVIECPADSITGTVNNTCQKCDGACPKTKLAATTTAVPVLERSDIECGSDGIRVFLPSTILPQHRNITWRDRDCRLDFNGSHFVDSIGLNECGTTVRLTNESVMFQNDIIVHTGNNAIDTFDSPITHGEDYDTVVPVKCVYPRNRNVSTNYLPVKQHVRFFERRYGQLNVSMQQYETEDFQTPITSFPRQVPLDSDIFVKLNLATTANNLGLRADNCIATSTPSITDAYWFQLIKLGCPSEGVQVRSRSGPHEVRFTFKAFDFNHHSTGFVYLHCEVSLCSVPESQCTMGCPARARRSADRLGHHGGARLVSTGPLHVTAGRTDEASISGATVVAIASLAVAMVAVVVAVVGWTRKPWTQTNEGV